MQITNTQPPLFPTPDAQGRLVILCHGYERADIIHQHDLNGWRWHAIDILPAGRQRITFVRKPSTATPNQG